MIFLLFAAALVGFAYLYSRLTRAEDRLNQNQYQHDRDSELIAGLTQRVWALERSQSAPPPAVAPKPVELEAPVVFAPSIAVRPPDPSPEPAHEPLPVIAIPESFREPTPPRRTWRDQFRDSMGGPEWEAVVGGSWLNKLGVLVLVIGIALLLGYEFAHVGPAGRVAIGMGVGLGMLAGGVFVERKRAYAIFARGLMGGGWAALYFTTYAMHALPAAKVIDNPYLGTALVLAVATGMIAHSLRYKSQTVSGLAYFIAFATLALSESTPFSVLALLPLAASLLYLAQRFEWHQMAVFGLFATYATCASRPDVGAPLASTQALFAMYWLLFETFDLLRLRRSMAEWTIESLILPVNALGFLGLSLVKWERSNPAHLYVFLAAGAAVYLFGAILRAWMRPPSAFDSHSGTLARIGGGSYEGSITLSAAMAAVAIMLRAPGAWVSIGLLIEGEILFLAGLLYGQKYLRQLAGAAFAGSVIKTVVVDLAEGGSITFGGRSWTSWSPVAVLSALVFYVNRMLRATEGALYSTVAAGLIALVMPYETPRQYLTVAWLAFAALLFEMGFRLRKPEFRYQSYIIGALGTGAGLVINSLSIAQFGARSGWALAWLPVAICAALHYAATLRIALNPDDDRLDDAEKKISWITAACAAAFLFVIAWQLVPGGYLGAAWLLLGAVLFELGLHSLPKHFRWLSYFVSAAGFYDMWWNLSDAIPLSIATAVCWSVSARLFRPMPARIEDYERERCRDLCAAGGVLFAMALMWLKLPLPAVALAWAALGLAMFETGIRCGFSRFRLLSHLVAAAVCVRLFYFDFASLGDVLHITYRTLTVAPVIASHYYFWWRYQRNSTRAYLYTAAILFLALARFELGSTWTVAAWAFFALALYAVGKIRNIADLRWQSFVIALLTFLFTTLTLSGNHARIFTTSCVIVSFYAAQLLAPRSASEAVERYARAFFSMLASILLAILLSYEVSGGTLTMALAVEALALLGAGFPLRDRLQRLSGLALFLICVLKLFLYDLRELETVSRILSFIVLGLILVGVSWMYTRFRNRIQRFL